MSHELKVCDIGFLFNNHESIIKDFASQYSKKYKEKTDFELKYITINVFILYLLFKYYHKDTDLQTMLDKAIEFAKEKMILQNPQANTSPASNTPIDEYFKKINEDIKKNILLLFDEFIVGHYLELHDLYNSVLEYNKFPITYENPFTDDILNNTITKMKSEIAETGYIRTTTYKNWGPEDQRRTNVKIPLKSDLPADSPSSFMDRTRVLNAYYTYWDYSLADGAPAADGADGAKQAAPPADGAEQAATGEADGAEQAATGEAPAPEEEEADGAEQAATGEAPEEEEAADGAEADGAADINGNTSSNTNNNNNKQQQQTTTTTNNKQ